MSSYGQTSRCLWSHGSCMFCHMEFIHGRFKQSKALIRIFSMIFISFFSKILFRVKILILWFDFLLQYLSSWDVNSAYEIKFSPIVMLFLCKSTVPFFEEHCVIWFLSWIYTSGMCIRRAWSKYIVL